MGYWPDDSEMLQRNEERHTALIEKHGDKVKSFKQLLGAYCKAKSTRTGKQSTKKEQAGEKLLAFLEGNNNSLIEVLDFEVLT